MKTETSRDKRAESDASQWRSFFGEALDDVEQNVGVLFGERERWAHANGARLRRATSAHQEVCSYLYEQI